MHRQRHTKGNIGLLKGWRKHLRQGSLRWTVATVVAWRDLHIVLNAGGQVAQSVLVARSTVLVSAQVNGLEVVGRQRSWHCNANLHCRGTVVTTSVQVLQRHSQRAGGEHRSHNFMHLRTIHEDERASRERRCDVHVACDDVGVLEHAEGWDTGQILVQLRRHGDVQCGTLQVRIDNKLMRHVAFVTDERDSPGNRGGHLGTLDSHLTDGRQRVQSSLHIRLADVPHEEIRSGAVQ